MPSKKSWVLFLTCLTIVVLVRLGWAWPKKATQMPTLQSSAKPITVRLYMNTEIGDRFAVLAGDGTICYVEAGEWLTLILGADYTCPWRPTAAATSMNPI